MEPVMSEPIVDEEIVEEIVEAQEPDGTVEDVAEDIGLGAPSLQAALEALLLLADEPMSVMQLAAAVREPAEEVEGELHRLAAEYTEQGRGFDLREVAGGWRYYTRAECSPLVERYVLDGQQARLTQASLETLAVIAYRQPITRGRVSAVRGVNVDGVIRTLLTRGLIAEAGSDGESGAHLYVTTSHFLERMGIASLDELPPLAEHLPDLADLEDVLDSVATGE
jgi:segregation and condensation protein B